MEIYLLRRSGENTVLDLLILNKIALYDEIKKLSVPSPTDCYSPQ